MRFLIVLIFLIACQNLSAQFQFSGYINEDFKNATAYLNIVDDFNKSDLFITEKILQTSKIDSTGQFTFKGNFLDQANNVYKIYIDACNDNIGDSKHLLNQCEESLSIIFIANNQDQIHFPLNDFSQMFCALEYSSDHNMAIFKIDSIQEELLLGLHETKSDAQRSIIYDQYFDQLQEYSNSLKEPLAELYAFHLYSDDKSFSREFYIKDLKRSNYYNDLLNSLEGQYSETTYPDYYKEELIKDQYPLLQSKNKNYQSIIYVLVVLLLVSLVVNFIIIRKNRLSNKNKRTLPIDYKTILSPQEQKVFELISQKLSNKEIAEKLFISLSTVKTHINNIYTKLSISSRNEIHHYF